MLQGIVDSELLFRHIAVGFTGSVHDSRVLQLSGIADLAGYLNCGYILVYDNTIINLVWFLV